MTVIAREFNLPEGATRSIVEKPSATPPASASDRAADEFERLEREREIDSLRNEIVAAVDAGESVLPPPRVAHFRRALGISGAQIESAISDIKSIRKYEQKLQAALAVDLAALKNVADKTKSEAMKGVHAAALALFAGMKFENADDLAAAVKECAAHLRTDQDTWIAREKTIDAAIAAATQPWHRAREELRCAKDAPGNFRNFISRYINDLPFPWPTTEK